MSLLGIDVGTSGCKAVLFTEGGAPLASAYEEFDYASPHPGWAELDAERIWGLVRRAIQAVMAQSGGDPARAVCVSSLGEAVVPVGAGREILGPSLLNFDARGAEFLPALSAAIDPASLYAANGNTLGNTYSLTKLLWVRAHQPDLYETARAFLHWSGFISFMLGADPAVDYTLANRTLLFDLEAADWSAPLLAAAGLDREKLPRVVAPGTVIGAVDARVAQELDLPAGIPIVIGGHDQCCSSLGCGVVAPGQAMYGMGTYICMVPVFSRRPDPAAMMAQGLCTEHHVVPGQFVSFIYNQGGALVKWYRDTFARAERAEAARTGADPYPALFAEMPPGPSGVMALPHFTVTGPPGFIDDSAGLIAGLSLATSRGEILKGLVEAATFYLRACSEALPEGISISTFRASGGGSRSDAWLQISADILGRPFVRPQMSEAGALGAALLAGAGSGVFSSLAEGVEAMVRLGPTFEPDPTRARRYDELYDLYRRLWPVVGDYLRALRGAQEGGG